MRQAIRRVAAVAAVLSAAIAGPAAHATEFATVLSAMPVSAQVPVPRQSCVETQQYVQQAPSGAGALVGAVAGGLLGNSIGGGFGRAAATGLGAVAGSLVGNQVETNAYPVTAVPVRRCQAVTAYENRLVGYDVTYEYAGQRYNTRMARDPGRQFAVDVRPAGPSTAATLPAPVYSTPAYSSPTYAAPVYSSTDSPAYYDPLPQPVYTTPYYPTRYYGAGPVVYGPPVIDVGIGYYGGYRGRHWR